ncbi:MAG: hypothetical protein NZM28_05270 [Fimbriimonadales bacterium]|nr:hypothetical protein [Fimbriimonadales bacterium]
MQHIRSEQELRTRLSSARRWQDHQQIQFEAIHNNDFAVFSILLKVYRVLLDERPTPLLRWAYANCTSEISEHNIHSQKEYSLQTNEFMTEEDAVLAYKRLIQEEPRQVIGYLGLARAYRASFPDEELASHYRILEEKEITIVDNGKPRRIRSVVADNPERRRRYLALRDKVLEIEPNNPFLPYWRADGLVTALVTRGEKVDLTQGLNWAVRAYESGLKTLYPIVCLGLIAWLAWKTGRTAEMNRYGEELVKRVEHAPRSAYSIYVARAYSDCPVIKRLLRR